MANEIHSLKIGNTEYPIYSEGLKIDDQVSGSAFLVVDGPDNRKVGTSTAIFGDGTNLTISSNEMYIGTNSTTKLYVGNTADYVHVGTSAEYMDVGNTADYVHVGTSANWVTVGNTADLVEVGNTADWVEVGTSAEYMDVGKSAITVDIGNSAEEVNIGHMSNSVNVGNQCTGDIVIGAGSVTTSEDEDGNEVVEKTTSTYIGENNYAVNIGNSANNVLLGGGAKTINIGSTTTSDISITTGYDNAEAAIEFYDTAGLYDASKKINIKSTEGKASGDDIYSQLVLNGAEVELISKYNSTHKSSIDMSNEYIIISNEQPNDAIGKRISSIELGDNTSNYSGINLTTSQCGINISTQYLADDLSVETGDLGDINIQSSDGRINLNSNSSTNIIAEGDLNLTTNHGDIDITSENHGINIDSGLHMGIKAAGWIKNHAAAFFIGDTIDGVPTDEYIEDCTHNVYINAFPNAPAGTTAPISIKSGAMPRVITTTRVDDTPVTDNITSWGGLSSLTNVEIGKEFNIKNDIISSNFLSSTVPNAATFSVGNKLKDSYTDTFTNVSLKTKADAEGVISMRVNDVYETNNNADVHSTIELTPLDYKSLCKWVDSDGESTYQSYMNMGSYGDTDNIVIGSKHMDGNVACTQQDIKISDNDNFTGIQLYGNYYDGESTASLDINYNGINLSYDYPPDATETYIDMSWDALKLSYNNDSFGVNETIELGTYGTIIKASNLKVVTPNIEIPVPMGNGGVGSPGIKLLHPIKNSNIGIVCYTPNNSAASASTIIMAPCDAYSSNAKVNLGISTKRFATIYVNAGYATTSFTSSSDERLKDFGDDIAVDLDALAALRKSYYRWNETSGFENEKDRMLGMSAQEVQKIYPEVVNIDDEGMLSMAYDRLSVVALAAIDKLHETNKELKAENDELKDRIANLENLVDTILSRIN